MPACHICKLDIEERALVLDGNHFHPDCLRCKVCRNELESAFCEKGGEYFCVDCYRDEFCPKCVVCKEGIDGSVLNVGGKSYHAKCFVCEYCYEPITSGRTYSTKNAKRCCSDCKPLFCGVCKQYCEDADRHAIDGAKDVFHLRCLACHTCKAAQTPSSVKGFNNKPYCESCFDIEKSSKVDLSQGCAGCRKPIDGKALLACKKQWHQDCFRCFMPGCTALLTTKFFEHDGLPYCEAHKAGPPAKSAAELRSNARDAVNAPPQGGGVATMDPTYDSMDTYDNHEQSLGGPGGLSCKSLGATAGSSTVDADEMYDNSEASVGVQGNVDVGDIYDNNDASTDAPTPTPAPAPGPGHGHGAPADDIYDNEEHGAADLQATASASPASAAARARPPSDIYDNDDVAAEPDYADATAVAVAVAPQELDIYDNNDASAVPSDDTYDNNEGYVAESTVPAVIVPEPAYAVDEDTAVAGRESVYSVADTNAAKAYEARGGNEQDSGDYSHLTRAELMRKQSERDYAHLDATKREHAVEDEVERRVQAALAVETSRLEAKIRAEVEARVAMQAAATDAAVGGGQAEYADVDEVAAAPKTPPLSVGRRALAEGGGGPRATQSLHTGAAQARGRARASTAEKDLVSSWLGGGRGSSSSAAPSAGKASTAEFVAATDGKQRFNSVRPGEASPRFKRVLKFIGGAPVRSASVMERSKRK